MNPSDMDEDGSRSGDKFGGEARKEPPPVAISSPSEEEAVQQALGGRREGKPARFTRFERRVLTGLCAIYALRIVGLYMVLPILSPYASQLKGATSFLTGISLGAYGLTQALFQIPFGHLSDRVGRKQAIVLGLLLFIVGSVVAAMADSVVLLIAGRAFQGMGAIASALVAMVADLTRPEVRTQAMARVGLWIGGAFAFGMMAGPLAAQRFGVPGLFWGTAILATVAAGYLLTAVPVPRPVHQEERVHAVDLLGMRRQKPLALLDVGTFLLHTTLTILFVILPFRLSREAGIHHMWKIAVPLVGVGLLVMAGVARLSDRQGKILRAFYAGSTLLLAACLVFALTGRGLLGLLAGTSLLVLAVAFLEPVLPALVSRFASGKSRGTAMGIFHMSQFLGTFAGGALGGAFLRHDPRALFAGLTVAVALWITFLPRVGGLHSKGLPPAPA